jgi:hypothetical protein
VSDMSVYSGSALICSVFEGLIPEPVVLIGALIPACFLIAARRSRIARGVGRSVSFPLAAVHGQSVLKRRLVRLNIHHSSAILVTLTASSGCDSRILSSNCDPGSAIRYYGADIVLEAYFLVCLRAPLDWHDG